LKGLTVAKDKNRLDPRSKNKEGAGRPTEAAALASEEGFLAREHGLASSGSGQPYASPQPANEEGALARAAIRFTAWAERWFPDAFVFVAIAVVVVAAAALANGAPVQAVTKSFGDGFWSLITFTMQMAFVAIGGYVVASSPRRDA
jgi:hypothetical protein